MDHVQLARNLESRAKASTATRPLIDREAAVGNDNTLWVTIDSHIRGTAYRYTQSDNPIEVLTRLVGWASELGTLTRTRKRSQISRQNGTEGKAKEEGKGDAKEGEDNETVLQEAMTADGPIWSNLPFLVQDMSSAWNEAMDPSIPTTHRHNLAAAIARLAGLGIRDDALSGCALSLMCEILETPRKLNAAASESESETEQVSPTVIELLPAVRLWLLYAGYKLLRLCDRSYDGAAWSSEASKPGELAHIAGVDLAGFSRARYVFWRNRLEELSRCDDQEVKKEVLYGLMLIDWILKEIEEPQLAMQLGKIA